MLEQPGKSIQLEFCQAVFIKQFNDGLLGEKLLEFSSGIFCQFHALSVPQLQSGGSEIRPLEVRSAEVRLAQVRAVEVRFAEVRLAQVGMAEVNDGRAIFLSLHTFQASTPSLILAKCSGWAMEGRVASFTLLSGLLL